MTTIKSIIDDSLLVREAAGNLTNRIEVFEKYLSELPGRVGASFALSGNAVLIFRRDGKAWKLCYSTDGTGIKPLTEAPLSIKMESVYAFVDLITAIKTSQDELLKKLKQSVSDFDFFWASDTLWKKL